jgi:hypothetical protein
MYNTDLMLHAGLMPDYSMISCRHHPDTGLFHAAIESGISVEVYEQQMVYI